MLISREIERRREIDRGLRASEARYRLLVDRNLAAIARTRRDGAVLECNQAMVRLLGCASREEVLGMNASDFYADPAERERLVSGFAPGGGVVDREVRFRRKNGEVIWVSITFLEYEDDGQPSFEAVMLDITDRKATSARIEELNAALARQIRDLAAANQELDAFSYSISHDLRAPLRAMQGFSEALLEDYGERLDATGHDYAHRIVAAEPADGHADPGPAGLQPARPRRGQPGPGEPRDGGGRGVRSARDGGQGARRRARRRAAARARAGPPGGARPDRDQSPDQRAQVHAGPTRRRACASAASGRAGACGSGWRTTASASRPSTASASSAPSSGCTGSQQYPGTGIGLAIVQKGATRLGGQAGVESEPGAGSRFWVELAEAEAAA